MADDTFDIGVEDAAALGALEQTFNPHAVLPGASAESPEPETWPLQGGWAWVWRVPGNETLTRPVIIADGFSGGSSNLDEWRLMWTESGSDIHHWGTQLREQGRDVIVLGYQNRSAALRDNAAVAIECIKRVRDERVGDAPLVVGGLSMGGLVTRYALALMEAEVAQHGEHEVGTYFSFDSPHRGTWIPISLQCFAHFLSGLADLVADPDKKAQLKAMSQLINSPASRELLWRHTASHLNNNVGVARPSRQMGPGWHSRRRWRQPVPGRSSRPSLASPTVAATARASSSPPAPRTSFGYRSGKTW